MTIDRYRTNYKEVLERTADIANSFVEGLDNRQVGRPVDLEPLRCALGGDLPIEGEDAIRIVTELATAGDSAIVATAGPRYFGFVVGGALPVAVAADWLTSIWDQNAAFARLSPLASLVEQIAGDWLLDLFGLPREMSFGFVTGGTMANFTAIAAARHALFAEAGWNVETQGLIGAPKVTVIASDESHVSIFASLQMLGMGSEQTLRVATDDQGRMRVDQLESVLATVTTPFLVCAQAGNVNTGAFDPIEEIAQCVRSKSGWLHIDGAFGVWAAASPEHVELVKGLGLANSVAVDCHKWLNVPYDCGVVFVRDAFSHRSAMSLHAPYYATAVVERDNCDWVPEASRRARGLTVYAALRGLGRKGLAALVSRCCKLALRMRDRLSSNSDLEILNDVVLNQVLVRFIDPSGVSNDKFTEDVIRRVQNDGTCWLGGTSWHGMNAMRISVSNWSTTESDIDASADAILRCAAAARKSQHSINSTT